MQDNSDSICWSAFNIGHTWDPSLYNVSIWRTCTSALFTTLIKRNFIILNCNCASTFLPLQIRASRLQWVMYGTRTILRMHFHRAVKNNSVLLGDNLTYYNHKHTTPYLNRLLIPLNCASVILSHLYTSATHVMCSLMSSPWCMILPSSYKWCENTTCIWIKPTHCIYG